ncbi:choline/carnitine O-acyltransferase [Vibrio eleionomae]|uniref:choline/carnitine O-acyltransferase n=1 Tax=Vibrio eleionomae TaxID=2653505 RepID=UPI00136ED0EB|nr:choline/carnitine O-acyltransferase [Vibrio eleionomae]
MNSSHERVNDPIFPEQPLPDLQSTCHKLIEWATPLLTAEECQVSMKTACDFAAPNGDGVKLQQALIEQSRALGYSNWSKQAWKDHYLRHRDSLVINSNVFYALKSKTSSDQLTPLHTATQIAFNTAKFMLSIRRSELPQEYQGKNPLCMEQYQYLFGATRIPQYHCDKISITVDSNHMVVLHHDHYFIVNLFDRNGDVRSYFELYHDLASIYSYTEDGENIGILTSGQRDLWARTREELLTFHAENATNFHNIESAAFALCFDSLAPQTDREKAEALLHGGGHNRHFDKVVQLIVFANGSSGINYEHTHIDGSIMLRFIRHLYDGSALGLTMASSLSTAKSNSNSQITPLKWSLSPALRVDINKAYQAFALHHSTYTTQVMRFNYFGKEKIKSLNISPDAFLQIALQVAEYKTTHTQYSAYEAIMTRRFSQGRIDVLYTVTPETQQFIQLFMHKTRSKACVDALYLAAKKHISRAKECQRGHGIYTHLMALKYASEQLQSRHAINQHPALFSTPAYKTLMHTVICTSTTSDYGVELAGYGPVVEDGYGLRYFKHADQLVFISTCHYKTANQMRRYLNHLEKTLNDMLEMLETFYQKGVA